MEALWECLGEELEESNWNGPNLFSPSGLPGCAVRDRREMLFKSDKSCHLGERRIVPRSCARRVPSRDEKLLASEGKLEWREETFARQLFSRARSPRGMTCVSSRVGTYTLPSCHPVADLTR